MPRTADFLAEEFHRLRKEGRKPDLEKFLLRIPGVERDACRACIEALYRIGEAEGIPPSTLVTRSTADEFESMAVADAGNAAFQRTNGDRPRGLRSAAEEFLDGVADD